MVDWLEGVGVDCRRDPIIYGYSTWYRTRYRKPYRHTADTVPIGYAYRYTLLVHRVQYYHMCAVLVPVR